MRYVSPLQMKSGDVPSTADDLSSSVSDSEAEIEFDDDFVVHAAAGNELQTTGSQEGQEVTGVKELW